MEIPKTITLLQLFLVVAQQEFQQQLPTGEELFLLIRYFNSGKSYLQLRKLVKHSSNQQPVDMLPRHAADLPKHVGHQPPGLDV
jgi:hypothetical protein